MKNVKQFKRMQLEFSEMLENNKGLKQYKELFEVNGIFTLRDLRYVIKTKKELGKMLEIMDENKVNEVWNIFNCNDVQGAIHTNKYNEGQITEYHY